ncbi:MAG: sigma factor [Actinomycetota bacterium]|nr:sigma factor [Actinomycetota bacterium]
MFIWGCNAGCVRTVGGVGRFSERAAAWAAAVDGNAEGFATVFDRTLDRVYWHALRLSGSRHDAEDLTAGAFLELWRRRRQVRLVEGSVLPWLLARPAGARATARRLGGRASPKTRRTRAPPEAVRALMSTLRRRNANG